MDLPIIIAIALSAILIIYLAFTSISKKSSNAQPDEDANEGEREREPQVLPRGGRRGLARMTGLRQRPTHAPQPQDELEDEEESEEGPKKKIGKKKLAKLQAKEERRQQRAAEEEYREQKRIKEEKLAEEQKKKELEREEEERKREEEEERRRQERLRKEEEEYQQWKQFMAVEGSGTLTQEQQEKESRIEEFITFVKEHKVVLLEDLAIEFNMKTLEVKELLEKLDAEGKISGLIDDRGKFIYVTREEMEKVANFINRKGRVSIEDIARESNKLINLNTKAED